MGYAVVAVVLADLAVIGFCVYFLARAGRALDERWEQQTERLDVVREGLERLVSDADGRARDLEQVLGARERHLRDILYRLAEQEARLLRSNSQAPAEAGSEAWLAGEARRLRAAGLAPVDIARELKADPAHVRLMLDLPGKAEERHASA